MAEERGTLAIRVRGFPQPIEFGDWTHDRLYGTVEFEGGDSTEILAFVGAVGSPIPGGSRTLTDVDTNIPRSGDTGLQTGWEMLIYSIQIECVREMARDNVNTNAFALQDSFSGAAAIQQLSRPAHVGGFDPAISGASGGVLFDFLRKTYHRFNVNQKIQSGGPSVKYPSGPNISVFGVTTGLEVASSSVPSPRDQLAFVLPIWLRPNIAYVSILKPNAALGIGGTPPAGFAEGYSNVWTGIADATARLGMDIRVTLEGLVKRPVV